LNPAKSAFHVTDSNFLGMEKDHNVYKVLDEDKAEESQAFMDLTYHLTQSKELFDTRRPGSLNPDGFVLMKANHNNESVFFIENHMCKDEETYMLWSVASGIPEIVLEAQQGRQAEALEAKILGQAVLRDLQHLDEVDWEQFRLAA
jgi:hypothetical protein